MTIIYLPKNHDSLESYLYSLEREEEYLVHSCSDIGLSDTLNLTPIARKSYSSESPMDTLMTRQYLTMLESLSQEGMPKPTEDTLMSSLLASRSRASHTPGPGSNLAQMIVEICGSLHWSVSMKLDPQSRGWKTRQESLIPDMSGELHQIWPQSGMWDSTQLYPAAHLEKITKELDGGVSPSIPTISATEWKGTCRNRFKGSDTYRASRMAEGLRVCESDPVYINPNFAEAQMSFPITWTELKPLETHRMQAWLQQHGEY